MQSKAGTNAASKQHGNSWSDPCGIAAYVSRVVDVNDVRQHTYITSKSLHAIMYVALILMVCMAAVLNA